MESGIKFFYVQSSKMKLVKGVPSVRPIQPLQTFNENKTIIPWSICELRLLFLWFLSLGQYYVDQLFFLFQNRNYKLHIESEYIV